MALTQAQKNRAERQESLRAYLNERVRLGKVIENIEKIEGLDASEESFKNRLEQLKVSNEQRMKLINKYLPELKATELTGESGSELTIQVLRFADTDTQ